MAASTSGTTCPTTGRYTTMRDSTVMILTVPLGTAYTDHLTRPFSTTPLSQQEAFACQLFTQQRPWTSHLGRGPLEREGSESNSGA
ncbi:hypothetical protein E4P35_02990 [Thiopseudomonas sp. 4R-3cl]|nr:hypothetical protein E4P35_02990 [Thiopseudomonas sp. 4R-3cl]